MRGFPIVRAPSPIVASLFGLLGAGVLYLAIPAPRATADVPTIGVGDVKKGMKGYGLTVFEGTTPEQFDVEVIDVLHKFRPNQDLILVKTLANPSVPNSKRLEKVNVVAGMSGSPIFLKDGATAKLAGAYAYGWSFGNEPVAGVTPIASMSAELGRPLSPILLPPTGKPPIGPVSPPKKTASLSDDAGSATAWSGDPGTYSIEDHVKQIAARYSIGGSSGSPKMVDSPLVVGGMSDRAVKELGTLLEPLGLVPMQGGGAGVATPAKDAPQHYVDGGAIAVQLMRGDSAAQATGTVTHVVGGGKLLGFGHPMMELGSSALPTAIAKILWVLSSDQRSFKIGEPVRDLGTLVQDRESCIVVDENVVAPTIPMSIDVEGDPTAPKKLWKMEVVQDRFMSPMWTAFAFADAIQTSINDHKDASWTLTSTIKLKGRATPIVLEDFGVSGNGVPPAAFFLSRAGVAVGELLNNPWEDVYVEKIDAKIEVSWKRDLVRLRGAEILESSVEAGETAHVRLTLKPYQGDEFTVTGAIKIDPALAGKDIDIEVAPAWTVYPEAASPESLDDLVENLSKAPLSPKSFVLQYKHPEQGVAIKGAVVSKLPPYAIDAFKATTSTVTPELFTPMVRALVDAGGYADGYTKVHLTVKPSTK